MTAQPLRWQIAGHDAPIAAPDRCGPGALQNGVAAAIADLRGAPVPLLAAMIGDARIALPVRIAAGQVLALVGDPRLAPLAPDMIAIAGGTVSIGLDPAQMDQRALGLALMGIVEQWIAVEQPRHSVRLAPYALARFPVTNGEYRVFVESTGHDRLPGGWIEARYPAERSNHPVHGVAATCAEAYAAWLAARTGRAFRLPTEAEWEYAAAGPARLAWPWGNRFDPGLCNTRECALMQTSPVGAFVGGESPFGVSDMAGNVAELVAAVPTRQHGVTRGGNYAGSCERARTQRRQGYNPRIATGAIGFRLAETLG